MNIADEKCRINDMLILKFWHIHIWYNMHKFGGKYCSISQNLMGSCLYLESVCLGEGSTCLFRVFYMLRARYLTLIIFNLKLLLCARDSSNILNMCPWRLVTNVTCKCICGPMLHVSILCIPAWGLVTYHYHTSDSRNHLHHLQPG